MSYAFKIWLWEFILFCVLSLKYLICSNNSRGWLFLFSHQKWVIIQWSWLFQILLTGSHAPNILFYYPIKQKIITSNKTEHGLFKRSKFGSLINFRSLDRLWSVLLDQIPLQLDRKVITERENGEKDVGGGGVDYSREAIILNISIRGGDYSWVVINRETAIIRGNTINQSINQSKTLFHFEFQKDSIN